MVSLKEKARCSFPGSGAEDGDVGRGRESSPLRKEGAKEAPWTTVFARKYSGRVADRHRERSSSGKKPPSREEGGIRVLKETALPKVVGRKASSMTQGSTHHHAGKDHYNRGPPERGRIRQEGGRGTRGNSAGGLSRRSKMLIMEGGKGVHGTWHPPGERRKDENYVGMVP